MTNAIQTLSGDSLPLPAPRRSYADLETWRAYETFFPERMRCTPESLPTEEWWSWNGLDVHIDRMAVPEARVKVIVLHGAGAYGRVMSPAAVIARRHGYETVCPDLPGYGLTQVPRGRMLYSLWVDCVCALIDARANVTFPSLFPLAAPSE